MTRDLFRLALRNIGHRRLRSWLTVIGILIGTAAIVALISIGQGLQRTITGQVERIVGFNTLIISPRTQGLGQRIRVDLGRLRAVPGVKSAMALRAETAYIEGPGGKAFYNVLGYDPAMDEFTAEFNLTLASGGRMTAPGQAILGSRAARELAAQVGSNLTVDGKPFTVVGVLLQQTRQTGGFGGPGISFNDAVIVSYEDFGALYPGPELALFAIVRLQDKVVVDTVKEEVRAVLRAGGERNASIIDFEDLTQRIRSVISGVQAFLAGIAGISILVGGIGVMNTMFMAVLERTREIGVMKAVGAKGWQVLLVYLFESGLMGLGGGALGLVFGLGAAIAATTIVSHLYQVQNPITPALSVGLIFGALFFSFVVGALSGVLPARRAAQSPPVEALRYE